MRLVSAGLLVCVAAASLPPAVGWSWPLHPQPRMPAAGNRRPLQTLEHKQPPALSGLALTSSHEWYYNTLQEQQQQQQLIPLKQEAVVIPEDKAQAAAEDAEKAHSAKDGEDNVEVMFYSFINAPDRPCPSGQYRDPQGDCRDAW